MCQLEPLPILKLFCQPDDHKWRNRNWEIAVGNGSAYRREKKEDDNPKKCLEYSFEH